MKKIWALFFILFVQENSFARIINFSFYGQNLCFNIDYEFQSISPSCLKEDYVWEMNLCTKQLSEDDFNWLFTQVDNYVNIFQIGDYGRKMLLEKCFEHYFNNERLSPTFYTWYFLCRFGYNVVLINQECNWEILFVTSDSIRMPSISFDSYKYSILKRNIKINLSNVDNIDIYKEGLNIKGEKEVKMTDIFSDSFPLSLENINILFTYDSLRYEFIGLGNINLSNYFMCLPNFEFSSIYHNVGCSKSLNESLIKFVKKNTERFSPSKSVDFVLKFIQEGIQYKSDSIINHYGVWQFPETSLLLKHGDCEDKSLLFSYIIQKAFGFDCILLDYGNHVNIGVAITQMSNKKQFDYIKYNDLNYYICDPSGDGYRFGQMPKEYKTAKYRIYSLEK